MDWEIAYYSDAVQETIGAWPAGIRAYYARLTERMCMFGPNLGMPFTRSMGQDLLARLHQEIAEDAATGTRSRPQALGRYAETEGR